jgi:hypothetical protein
MVALASYKVNIREGRNTGVVQCTGMVTEKRVQEIFRKFYFANDNNYVHMGHIGGTVKSEESDCMRFNKNDVNSMSFDCKNREHAEKCLKYFGLLTGS